MFSIPRIVLFDHHRARRYPLAITWMSSVAEHRFVPLGVGKFGQTGTIPDFYQRFGIDADAIAQLLMHMQLDGQSG